MKCLSKNNINAILKYIVKKINEPYSNLSMLYIETRI